MMDFGYLGSSSNLSALAPPFTLDRSNPKSNTDLLVHFTDPPPAVPFSSSLPSWQYSLSSVFKPDFYPNSNLDLGVDSIRTEYLTSDNYYRYFGIPSVSSPTHVPSTNSNLGNSLDAFTFNQYPGEIPSNHVESKPYYSSFVSPVVDQDAPLVALSEPSYDLSSTSRISPLDGSSQVDYHQSLSGLKYTPQWGSYWDRINSLADGEMDKQVDVDGGLCSVQTDGSGSYVYTSYQNQGVCTVEGSNTGKETSAVPHQTCLNLLGGESQIATPTTGELNSKPFSMQDPRFYPNDPVKTSRISPLPKSHLRVPSLEATTTFCNYQKLDASYDKSFQPVNSCTNGSVSVKRASPALVIRPPSVGPILRLGKVDPFFDSSSSNIKGELPNKPFAEDVEDHMSKAGFQLKLPDMNASYSFTLASDRAKGIASVECSSESSDRYYPAVDSPCWKGVPASSFFPSEDLGAATSENLVKKPETFNGLKLQETQFFTPFSEDTAQILSQSLGKNCVYQENGYIELGSLLSSEKSSALPSPEIFLNPNCPKEYGSTHKVGLDPAKMSGSNEVHDFNNIDKLKEECDVPNDLNSYPDLRPSQWKQPDPEKSDFTPEKDRKLGSGVAKTGLNSIDMTPKLNIQMLVDAIYNLSELLLLQCSNETVLEFDHSALKHAIDNLDACVSKKIVYTPIQESTLSEQCICHECMKLPDLHKGVISDGSLVIKEADASSRSGFDHHCPIQGKLNSELSGKEVKKFPDLLSSRVDEDIVKDDKVARAIKKVLDENFSIDEEMEPETLFYKNLWLEAEAALCSVSYRARFDRMKIEMEKCKSPNTKAETTKTVEKPHSEDSPDLSVTQKGIPHTEDSTMLYDTVKDPSTSRRTETVGEAEASVKARLHINNELNQNSVNTGGQQEQDADARFSVVAETVETVEKKNSSEVPPKTNVIQKVTDHAKDDMVPDNTVDDVESSVMARFRILKNRGLDANSAHTGQRSGQVVDAEFGDERNPWRFNSVLLKDDIVDRPLSHCCGGNSISGMVSEDEAVKDFHVCASDDQVTQPGGNHRLGIQLPPGSDDQVTQPGGNHRLGIQLPPGWCDGSLSDWEDVLKDEFACQK